MLFLRKRLTEIWENKLPKLAYGLHQTLFLAIDESNFWTSSDIVLPIKLLSGLTEERVRSILQQPNNFKKKSKQCTWKNPDLTEAYLAFILSEGKVGCIFIGKSCSNLDDITLHTINNYQSNVFFSLTSGYILEKMHIVKEISFK